MVSLQGDDGLHPIPDPVKPVFWYGVWGHNSSTGDDPTPTGGGLEELVFMVPASTTLELADTLALKLHPRPELLVLDLLV